MGATIRLEEVSQLPLVNPNLLTDFVIGVQSIGNGNYRAVRFPANYITGGGLTLYAADLTGPANDYLASIPAKTSYNNNDIYFFNCGVSNTGATTVTVNSLAARPVKKFGLVALQDLEQGDLIAGQKYGMIDTGTVLQIFSVTNNILVE